MADIVDQILNDPCATINETDAEELRKLDPGTLKRLVLGLQTQERSIQNQEAEDEEAAQIEGLKKALASTQQHLRKLLDDEAEIRDALDDYGVSTKPVVERTVAVANQKSPQLGRELSPKLVEDFVHFAQNPLAQMLREGLLAAKQMRQKSIDVIVSNASGEYTPDELQRMPTAALEKLARVLESKTRQVSQDPLSLSWEGLGLADQSINQTPAFRSGGTLDITPSSMEPGAPTMY